MEKVTTLKALLSSTEILMMHHDILSGIAFIPFGGTAEPILILDQSELVGWIRLEEDNASGNTATCSAASHPPPSPGKPYDRPTRTTPSRTQWTSPGIRSNRKGRRRAPQKELERFVACVEAGQGAEKWLQTVGADPR